ncbi:hypothetical protein QOZ80_5AG0362100 [Eleusine coracana subsp. coracana]|nr:hypothetical protein QOZ80_5AG0362100 [Eleusine coracana subsp. coracana]
MASSPHSTTILCVAVARRAQEHHFLFDRSPHNKMRGLVPSRVLATAAASRKRKLSRSLAAMKNKKRVVPRSAGGQSLRRRIATVASSRGRLPEAEVREYMRQLLRATKRAHARGLVHGDITPDNILVAGPPDDGKTTKLELRGFSRVSPVRGPDGRCILRTTMRYRSPELLNYIPCFLLCEGPAADVYALGCVMYELVTGDPLFKADTAEELLVEAEELHDALIELEEGYDGLNLGELSLHGQQVLSGLLQFFDCERLTAADALKHPWFTESPRTKTTRRSRAEGRVEDPEASFGSPTRSGS